MRLMLYSALMHGVRALAWPVMSWLGRRVPAYRERWGERRARIDYPDSHAGGIVVHAVSMGEVMAALPLVEELLAACPELPLTMTCTTPTASELIRERLVAQHGDRVLHVYMPFDTPGAVKRFVQGLRPRLLIVMETELWPNLLTQAQAAGARVVVANARLSERSARSYRRWMRWVESALLSVDLWLAQDADTVRRLRELGMAPARLKVSGNFKFDTPLPAQHDVLRERFTEMVGARRWWLAASTHEGEESQLLDVHARLRETMPDLLLVLVPRHPQRFDPVARLVQSKSFAMQRRSDDRACEASSSVLLGDSMGELTAWFAIAPVVFMGGSLITRGGHNPLEPMQFGAPIISGPHVFNFQQAFDSLQQAQACITARSVDELVSAVARTWQEPAAMREMGLRGQRLHAQLSGAVERSLAHLDDLLEQTHLPDRAHEGSDHVWWDARVLAQSPVSHEPTLARGMSAWLDPQTWRDLQALTGEARGRSTVWFVREPSTGAELVLRHYHRGGLMGRLMGDRFWQHAGAHSRATDEYALLARMRATGLAVPRPVAARVRRSGVFERCDILVERVEGAQDWVQILQAQPIEMTQWQAMGVAIAALHEAGVYHSDLNAHNLLSDAQGKAWIIDFDKCGLRRVLLTQGDDNDWREANLKRLKRSLDKEARLCREAGRAWHGDEAGWQALVQAYRKARQGVATV
jgi:3-deoxy-D-manno-octulosonic-acid transferase